MIEAGLKKIAAICAGLMLFVIGIAVLLETEPDSTALAGNSLDNINIQRMEADGGIITGLIDEDMNAIGETADITEEAYMIMSQGTTLVNSDRWKEISGEFTGNIQILLPAVPEGAVITVDEEHVTSSVKISIDNSSYELPDMSYIQRIAGGKYYMGKHDSLFTEDPVRKIAVNRHESNTYEGTYCTDIRLKLDSVYTYNMHTFDDVMCIDVINPRQVYENIIVLDAGHGGPDVGCSSTDGRHYEKDITLDIVKRLKKKLDKTNIKVYYTRLEDEGLALHQRVDTANALKADMFVSIHCNYYEHYWVPGVNGAETLYSSVCKKQKNNSRELAVALLDALTDATGMRKRGVINRKNDLHVLRESKVPAVIIETGYMSDKSDLKQLTTAKNVKKIVNGIYDGIIMSYKNLYGKEIQ